MFWICGREGRRAAPGFSLHSEGMECVIGVSNPLKHKHTMWKAGFPAEAARVGFSEGERSKIKERKGGFVFG